MKSKTITKAKLRGLIRKWKRSARIYDSWVVPEWNTGDRYASRRYEGEALGIGWCAKDLEDLLK